MELRQLRQFVVLSETRNFHRAAERLHMAQPPLSTSIRKLEEELGVQLFDRAGQVTLTGAGKLLLQHATRVLNDADQLRQAAAELATGEQGSLTIGFVGSAIFSVLARVLPPFRQAHPRIRLVLLESTTVELLQSLRTGVIDVALVRTPLLVDPGELALVPLERNEWMLAVPADSPLAARDSVSLAEVGDQPFIVFSREKVPSIHALTMMLFDEAGIRPNIAQEAGQLQTLLGMVESGLGLAMVASSARSHVSERVRLLSLSGGSRVPPIGIAMAYPPERAPAAVQRFAEVARSTMHPGN